MSHGVFSTCTQSVTKVTLSIAMTINNTPTTCPPLAFVNLWLNHCGTEGRHKSHLTYSDKNNQINNSCSFPHNSLPSAFKKLPVYTYKYFKMTSWIWFWFRLCYTFKQLQIILSFVCNHLFGLLKALNALLVFQQFNI